MFSLDFTDGDKGLEELAAPGLF